MFFEKLQDVIVPKDGTVTVTSPLAQAVIKQTLDRSFPLEKIFVIVTGVVSAVIATPSADALIALVKNITLETNGGTRPRKVVDASGADLIDLAMQENPNLDRDTLAVIGIQASGTGKNIAAATFKITIPISCPHPSIVDPLRTLFLLPLPNHPNDPLLTITTGTRAEVDVNGTPTFVLTSMSVEIMTVRRNVPKAYNEKIVTEGGYIDWDLLAGEYAFPNTISESKTEIPAPGNYANLLCRHYTTTGARADITGDTVCRLETQNSILRRFRFSHVQIENDMSRSVVQTLSGASTLTSQTTVASHMLDFLTDESCSDVNELGSVLDTSTPLNAGQKTNLIMSVTGGAAVKMRLLGRRYLSDISRFQAARG